MLFEFADRRKVSEFILIAILKFMERQERMQDMIFYSREYCFKRCSWFSIGNFYQKKVEAIKEQT